jgi:hypothetical protein
MYTYNPDQIVIRSSISPDLQPAPAVMSAPRSCASPHKGRTTLSRVHILHTFDMKSSNFRAPVSTSPEAFQKLMATNGAGPPPIKDDYLAKLAKRIELRDKNLKFWEDDAYSS